MKNVPQPLATELEILALEMEVDSKAKMAHSLNAFLRNDDIVQQANRGCAIVLQYWADKLREILK